MNTTHHEPEILNTLNDPPSFENITLQEPVGIQGGAILSRIKNDKDMTLLFQTCELELKQSFNFQENESKQAMQVNFDMNTKDGNIMYQWLNAFEKKIKERIFQSRDKWFDGDIDEDDVDYFFQSGIKTYKQGNSSMRLILSRLSKPIRDKLETDRKCEHYGVNIYDEQETPLDFSDISPCNTETGMSSKSSSQFIAIIEPFGVKFTSTSFHIIYHLRQMMILSQSNKPYNQMIKQCFIRKTNDGVINSKSEVETEAELEDEDEDEAEPEPEAEPEAEPEDEAEPEPEPEPEAEPEPEDELQQVNLENILNISDETIQLKSPNQVYIDLYKQMRRKAKQSKQEAEQSFLEAENIKHNYQLNTDEIDTDTENE